MPETPAQFLLAQARERLMELTKTSRTPLAEWWVWLGIAVVLALVSVYAFTVWHRHRKERQARSWQTFRNLADNLGLSDEERVLLARVATVSGLKRPELVFTSDSSFYNGVASLQRYGNSSEAGKNINGTCSSCVFLSSLREKLGFQIPTPEAKTSNVNLSRVRLGKTIRIIHPEAPDGTEAMITAIGDENNEFAVKLQRPIEKAKMGENWVVRYPQGGVLWEFSTWVLRKDESDQIHLRPVGEVRLINRRRFIRVPTRKSAFIAHFPFSRDEANRQPPEFHSGVLVEIAGPGIQIRSPLEADIGAKMLVVIDVGDELIEGMGIVRRVQTEADQLTTLAVEMIGLSTDEVAELAKVTNHAAKENKVTGGPAHQKKNKALKKQAVK
ncbi:MAG: hypothetical protein ACLFVU_11475 [Phycisphaerae bacterium]